MNWFRSNIQLGSRLALFALAIQFVLSFGHFHPIASATATRSVAIQASLADLALVAAAPPAQQQQPAQDHDSDQTPDDGCAICAVIALAHTALFSTPPVLPVPQAVEFAYHTAEAEFGYLNAHRVAFQPRAPPLS
jgi:hypothetical protein